MLTSHQRHSKLRTETPEEENERPASRHSADWQRRRLDHQQQQQRQQQQQGARVPPIQHHSSYYRRDEPLLDEEEGDCDEEQDWRQGAQMLTERDEMLLLADSSRFGADTTDVAPVNRRRLQQQMRRSSQSPSSSSQQNRSPTPKQAPASSKSASQLASRMLFTSSTSTPKKSKTKRVEGEPNDLELDQDDNSSISFAQSGCQSILSAWRLKAANRKRQRDQQPRPTSVLSNSSSVGKKSAVSTAYTLASRLTSAGGKSPATQTRIALGPKSAQHFVTNSRRRRRANELILNTLEARRRALSLNRQQNLLLGAGGSLFGSESYLLAADTSGPGDQRGATPDQLDYQRLSLSPSPVPVARTPSPLLAASQRRPAGSGALSDLGGLVRKVQAKKLQNMASVGAKSRSQSSLNRAPPLAKLDQNSSDLCSSNDSSSGESSSSSSSSSSGESRFTQLVTSELAPVERALMNEPQLSTRYLPAEPARWSSRESTSSPARRTQVNATSATAAPPSRVEPPQPPARSKRKQLQQQEDLIASKTQVRPQARRQQQRQMVSSDEEEEEEDGAGSRLRRGALKRDSIRRLRLSRQSSSKTSSSSSREEANADGSPKFTKYQRPLEAATPASKQTQPLSKSRKLDIESNPFLNRHHFRSLSQRSSDSGRPASQASRRAATPSQLRSSQRSSRATSARGANEEPEVRRVEQMLRQMKPGQLLEARSRERELSHSEAMDSKTRSDSRGGRRPVARQDDLAIRSSPSKMQHQHKLELRARNEVSKVWRSEREREHSELSGEQRNEFKTTTRLVREGARSSDDVKMDLVANRRVSELTSKRLERLQSASISPPPEFSDRLPAASRKALTSSEPAHRQQPALPPKPPSRSSLTRSAFSPAPTVAAKAESRALVASERQLQRAVSEDRAARSAREWTSAASKSGATPTAQQASTGRQTGAYQRPLSSQQLAFVAGSSASASSPSLRASKGPQRSAATASGSALAASRKQEIDPIARARMLQANLPKFERTADDEFRKRVDQLRQLARANLHSSELEDRAARSGISASTSSSSAPTATATKKPASSALEVGASSSIGTILASSTTNRSRFLTEQKPATLKPLSLNWSGPKDNEPRVISSRSSLLQSRSRRTVASTNLDDMLLADKYQRPLPATGWRRSNSSLASLSSARAAPQRPMSPFGLPARASQVPKSSDSLLSQSAVSIGPREPSDAAELVPMRLVVKEKSAPKRDFAFVEQRAPVQRVEHRNTGEAQPATAAAGAAFRPSELQRQRPQTPPRQQPVVTQALQCPTTVSPKPTTASQSSVQQAPSQLGRRQLLARSRQAGTTSPRSPDSGPNAANSSSNDDSAIASSVSSPSLSFSLNPSGLQSAGGGGGGEHQRATSRPLSMPSETSTSVQRPAPAATPTDQSQLTGLRVAVPQDHQAKAQTQTIGALQSILRRQQQLRRQQETVGEPKESQPASSSQTGGSYLVPIGSTSYTHTSQTSLTKTTTTLTRQPADASIASISVQPSELEQFADNQASLHVLEAPQQASSQQQQQQAPIPIAPVSQKRVNFNDRISVRSFESLSSENSNSTAINNGAQQNQQLTGEQQRQLIGSPDSMGSGSTSRLSCDSPDFRRVGSGGAIYAIRGDPELEQSPVNMLASQQLFSSVRQPLQASQQQQAMCYQQTTPMQLARPLQHPVAVSIAQQQFNQRQQQQQQQQLSSGSLGSPTGCIRMTAPPVINTAGANYPSQMMVSPRAGQPMLASPNITARPNQLPPARPAPFLDDEEDPNYAFRLRQAAANRAFNFIQQQKQKQQLQQQPTNLNRSAPTPAGGGDGGGGSQAQRRQPIDPVNFQTEV